MRERECVCVRECVREHLAQLALEAPALRGERRDARGERVVRGACWSREGSMRERVWTEACWSREGGVRERVVLPHALPAEGLRVEGLGIRVYPKP